MLYFSALMLITTLDVCHSSSSILNWTKECKAEDGKTCVFPFTYKKQKYYGCQYHKDDTYWWCSTEEHYNWQDAVQFTSDWKYCPNDCPKGKPKIVKEPSKINSSSPDYLLLECSAEGSPNPDLSWVGETKADGKNKIIIRNKPDTDAQPQLQTIVLALNSTHGYGKVWCEASNTNVRVKSGIITFNENRSLDFTYEEEGSEDTENVTESEYGNSPQEDPRKPSNCPPDDLTIPLWVIIVIVALIVIIIGLLVFVAVILKKREMKGSEEMNVTYKPRKRGSIEDDRGPHPLPEGRVAINSLYIPSDAVYHEVPENQEDLYDSATDDQKEILYKNASDSAYETVSPKETKWCSQQKMTG